MRTVPRRARVAKLLKANSKLGKAADAGKLSSALQDAWRAHHRGDFQTAFEAGEKLGALGASVAVKAGGIHAVYLLDDEKEQLKRYEALGALAEAASKELPDEPTPLPPRLRHRP